jgi:4-hydroxy-3-polyprenylbenzoate decarboxylase
MRIVVAITGASGSAYAVRLIEELAERAEVLLVASEPAKQILPTELDITYGELEELAAETIDNDDMAASICSGSAGFDSMVVVPCSMNTLGKLAGGIADNVVARAGSVALKEGKKLVLVPRETPLNTIQIENMLKMSKAGAVVLPPMPGFYGRPETAMDLVDFVVGRILDQLGIENELAPRWGEEQSQ